MTLHSIIITVRTKDIKLILSLLEGEYGLPRWRVRGDPVAVLVQTILSQNTSDRNSEPAFRRLMSSFGGWNELAGASEQDIARCIQSGGLAKVKAKYIKQALTEIRDRSGGFDLGFLKGMSVDDARRWLMELPGVGIKTASCVLLFGLNMPALPVDTHVFRVAKRLGLIEGNSSVEKAHRELELLVAAADVYKFHVLLITHGRRACRARLPYCTRCVLREVCKYYGRG
jgi:endonuclease-3